MTTNFAVIRTAFRLCMEERLRHYLCIGDDEHATIWRTHVERLKTDLCLHGVDTCVTDLFAKVYTELRGNMVDYEKHFDETFKVGE